MTRPRLLTIMGSGETAPTMTKVHRAVFDRFGSGSVPAVMLDTPFGFQANADELTTRAVAYFRDSVDRPMGVASMRRASDADALDVERLRLQLREADLVFAGPGSPTYALRQWAGGPVPEELATKLREGGCVSFSSAAALTLGVATVPVYEVYKVGADPVWLPGLDLTAATGLSLAVIPHYDNAEGGTHDTRFCYLGETRLRRLEDELEPETFVLGIDEHTAAVFDLEAGTVEVLGRGVVTVRVRGKSSTLDAGTVVGIATVAEMAEGLRRGGAPQGTPQPQTAPIEVEAEPSPDRSPLLDAIAAHERAFDEALRERDATSAVKVVLALEDELHAWRADTLQTDDAERGRSVLRGMVVRLGDAAGTGVRDPREVAAPWVEAMLALRAAARADRRWADADVVRDHLVALGVEVRDDPAGTVWELRPTG